MADRPSVFVHQLKAKRSLGEGDDSLEERPLTHNFDGSMMCSIA